ncbi:hypothetical protein D3C86_1529070 [compost metagenome]
MAKASAALPTAPPPMTSNRVSAVTRLRSSASHAVVYGTPRLAAWAKLKCVGLSATPLAGSLTNCAWEPSAKKPSSLPVPQTS